ncbi:MAG TPA: RNA polymerase sigma factor [Candidatus Krumholzibacteria bacterium]|nr:RNA polymerase sigma factor [Candidatus Krumholzibacteria bacterium]
MDRTAVLLDRIRAGDARAADELAARFLPPLRRWARGRLPLRARHLAETDDLVQIALVRALNRVEDFDSRREGAFLAYLRQILLNALRDEIRRADRHGERVDPEDAAAEPSLVEDAVGVDVLVAYETALAELPPTLQEAIVLRVEFQWNYAEIAAATGSPSANATRMAITRGLVQLAEVMRDP